MATIEDLNNAKKAYDVAWSQAVQYSDEALQALNHVRQTPARGLDDIYMEKAKRALAASDNWRKSAALAQKVMGEVMTRIHQQD
jgi:hypothetical protein